MLASASSTVSALVESPRSIRGGRALRWSRKLAAPIWARSTIKSSVIDAAQKTPIAIWVPRQPMVCTPQVTRGGHSVPAT